MIASLVRNNKCKNDSNDDDNEDDDDDNNDNCDGDGYGNGDDDEADDDDDDCKWDDDHLPLDGSWRFTCCHLDSIPWVWTCLLSGLMKFLLWFTVVSSLSQ